MAKILLVEDDNNLREIYEARLQAEGYQIISANDGESALVIAKKEKPDLIISDVMMPKISGFEMLDILRNTEGLKDVKVVMLTALGQADDQARANQLGADRYLVKSQVTLEDIVKVSHDLLDVASNGTAAEATESSPPADSAATPPVPATSDEPAEPTATIPVTAAPADPSTDTAQAAESSLAAPPADDQPATITIEPPSSVGVVDDATTSPSEASSSIADDTTSAPQSSAQEESAIEKQIEDFVNTTSLPTSDQAADNATAATPTATDTTSQVADDKVLADAVDSLTASVPANDVPATSDEETTAQPVTATEEVPAEPIEATDSAASTENVTVAHRKVIKPLDSNPQKSLDELVAEEEAQNIIAGPTDAPATALPAASTADEQPAGAPTPAPSSQAETTSKEEPPVDPNSIAL